MTVDTVKITRSPDYVCITWADMFGRWHARVTDGPTARRRAQSAIRREIEARQSRHFTQNYRVRVTQCDSKHLRYCQVVGQVIYREV